jgi:hypothetical protein
MKASPKLFSLAATIRPDFSPIASFALDPGDWEVKPVKGDFTAWSAWRETEECRAPTDCDKGWLTSYHIWSLEFVDHPKFIISVPSRRCDSEVTALENAEATRFRLRKQALVSFFILDSYKDNRGGLSLSLKQV